MRIEINFNRIIDTIIIFLLIYLTSSFVGVSIRGFISIGILLIVFLSTLILRFRSIKINYEFLIMFIILFLWPIFVMLFNKEGIYNYLIYFCYLIIAFLTVIQIKYSDFKDIFVKIMVFLSLFSLAIYFISLIFPQLIMLFPTFINRENEVVYNALFTVVNLSSYINRNFGLFWEPGAYQAFLIIALFFSFTSDFKNEKMIIIILSITLITTVSTTGLIGLFLFLFIYIVDKVLYANIKRMKKVFYILSPIIIFILTYIIIRNLPYNIYFNLIGKLEGFFSDALHNNLAYTSANARRLAVKISIDSFMKSPIIGVGFDNYSSIASTYNTNLLTFTPMNWFAIFGVVYGIFINIAYFNMAYQTKKKMLIILLMWILLLLIISTENVIRNGFFLTLILYNLPYRK